jgi:dipeptidyl aminopeptidase/acylaminoacyl peptidase
MMAFASFALGLAAALSVSGETIGKPALSGDGQALFFVADDDAGQAQLFVRSLAKSAPLAEDEPRQLTHFSAGRITQIARAGDMLYVARAQSDGRSGVDAVDTQGAEVRSIFERFGRKTSLLAVHASRHGELLLTVERDEAGLTDVWRISGAQPSGAVDTVNPGDVVEWKADAALVVRGAVARLRNGNTEIRVRRVVGEPFRPLVTASVHETLAFHGFSADGRSVFLTTSVSARFSRVVEKNIATGTERVLAQWPQHDVESVQFDNVKATVEAVSFRLVHERKWVVVGWVRADFEALRKQLSDGYSVLSRDQGDNQWIVETESTTERPRLYRLTRSTQRLESLDSEGVAGRQPVGAVPTLVTSADNPQVQGALVIPPQKKAVALVMLIEGGPLEGAVERFSLVTRHLVQQGLAVLRVSLPASVGRGKRRLGVDVVGVDTADSLAQLVKAAQAQVQLGTKTVGVVGEHLAGSVALLMAARHADTFSCLAVRDAPLNYLTQALSTENLSRRWAQLFEKLEQPETLAQWTAASPVWVTHLLRGSVLLAVTENQNWTTPAEVTQLSGAMRASGSRLALTSSGQFADLLAPHLVACLKAERQQ